VLGKVTATGKFAARDADATDGVEAAVAAPWALPGPALAIPRDTPLPNQSA
jgi:hypothetical protein